MKNLSDNYQVFNKIERKWGDPQLNSLSDIEQYLLSKYLHKSDKILEAGCGGGRICQCLAEKGYENIDAFDFVEQFIKNAQSRNLHVHFFVADASNLSMLPNGQYDGLIYLEQMLCFLPYDSIKSALRESHRVCRDGGTAIFSVLNYRGRKINRILSPFLSVLRRLRRESLLPQQLPWLRYNGRPNYHFWAKGEVTNYWFTREEFHRMLSETGYDVIEALPDFDTGGNILYVVCRKQGKSPA